jgi:hypothetical protein
MLGRFLPPCLLYALISCYMGIGTILLLPVSVKHVLKHLQATELCLTMIYGIFIDIAVAFKELLYICKSAQDSYI